MVFSTLPTSWPPVVMGLIMGIYWLKVMMLVVKTRREAGHGANLIPPEPLGRLLRWIWIPVVVLWIVVPLVAPFITGLPWLLRPVSVPGGELLGWTAVGVGLIAFAITWVCWIKMGTSWRMGIDPNERTKLVFNGPFAYVRHPIYGLSQVLMLMSLVAWPSPLMFLIAALHLLFMQWEVRREEKYLVVLHGPAYEEYQRRVGRFVPRMGAWK